MPEPITVLLDRGRCGRPHRQRTGIATRGLPGESFESAERVVPHIKPGMPAIVVSDVGFPAWTDSGCCDT